MRACDLGGSRIAHTRERHARTVVVCLAERRRVERLVADGMIGARHKSNNELIAQGVGNIASVMFGGLPATGAIARTAANVKAGGRTPLAGMIHAVFILGAMLALAPYAGKILRDHIQLFINFDAEPEAIRDETPQDAEFERVRKILLTPVDELELSVRSHNCLRAANIKTIADLVRRDEAELLKFRNFGRKSLAELSEIIEEQGLSFGMDVGKYLKDGE